MPNSCVHVTGCDTTYLSAIEELLYLTNTTCLYIAFPISLLARFSSSTTQKY